MAHVRFRLEGTAPLMQHNERLANPLDPAAKEIAKTSKKRSKTEADYELLAKLEFKGGLYHDEDIGPYIPAKWIDKMLEMAGKREKLGSTMKAFARCVEDFVPLEYDGPRDIEKMWKAGMYDIRPVNVSNRKTLRCRPLFEQWAIEFTILYDDATLDRDQIVRCMERAGESVGLGDYRPRYGRFSAEVVNEQIAQTKRAA